MGNISFSTVVKLNQLIENVEDEDLKEALRVTAANATEQIISSYYHRTAAEGGIDAYLTQITGYGDEFLKNIQGVQQFVVDYVNNLPAQTEAEQQANIAEAEKLRANFFNQNAQTKAKIDDIVNDIGKIILETNADEAEAASKEAEDAAAAQEAQAAEHAQMVEEIQKNPVSPVMKGFQ